METSLPLFSAVGTKIWLRALWHHRQELRLHIPREGYSTMVNSKKRQVKAKDEGPIEKTKKLPAAFPDKFDIEQDYEDNSADQKRGTGARFHGSM